VAARPAPDGFAIALGIGLLLGAVIAGVAALAGLSYWRAGPDDPGLTIEAALVLTALLLAATSMAALAALAVPGVRRRRRRALWRPVHAVGAET
jgi:hypothetical protein